MSAARRLDWTSILTAAPAVLVTTVCCAMPLMWMAAVMLANPQVRSELHVSSFRAHLLARTLGFNGMASVIATAMGLPAALVLGRGRGWLSRFLWVILPGALLMPSLSYAYGWGQFIRLVRLGLEDYSLRHFGPEHMIRLVIVPGGWADCFRCIWSLAAWLWAVPAGVIGLALRRLDTNVQQQAILDGALFRITFRQLVGPIIASMAIVTVLATQEFAVYEPTGISVVATEVRMVFDTGAVSSANNLIAGAIPQGSGAKSPDQPQRAAAAVATALPLVGVTVLLAVVAAWGASQAGAADTLSIGLWPEVLNAPLWAGIVSVLLLLLNVGLPTWALIKSLRVPFSVPTMWLEFGPQVQGAIFVAAIATAVATLAAFSAAGRWTPGLLVLAGASFLIGGQLLAIALIRIYNRGFLDLADWAYDAWPVPVIAYVGRFGWLALVGGRGTWSKPWRELRDMASVDGAGTYRTAASIVWPLGWPTLAAGALLVGALSLTEVPATVLLFPQNPQVLTPLLMTWVHMARFDPMIEASLLMMISVLVPAAAALTLITVGLRLNRLRAAADNGGDGGSGSGGASRGRGFPVLPPGRMLLWTALLLLPLALLSGCTRSSQPQAIWCETGTGPGQVVYPRGIAFSSRDRTFYTVDRRAHIQHLDYNGNCICYWTMPGPRIEGPCEVDVAPDGNVYVADTHGQCVIEFSPDGHELRRWGSAGTADGQFIYPTDVAFDRKGRIFISEYGDNDRIQVFDQNAHFLFKFGSFGQGNGQFSRPEKMVLVDDTIYVTDACNHRIDVFTTEGKWLRNFGSCGSGLGQFRFPYGMSINSKGQLVVSEFGNNRVQLVDKQTGQGLALWGHPGREPGQLAYPWGVAVDDADRVVSVDSGNNRLQVFQF